MIIRLTNPDYLDKVIAKLDQLWPFNGYNDAFIKYCVPSLKERLRRGETIYLESEIGSTNFGVCHMLSYWSSDDVLTDENYLNSFNLDESK